MKFNKLALSVAISSALLLSGCGGGGDNTTDMAGTTATLSGKAAKGIIVNGLVTAYELVGAKWVDVGAGITDASGQYTLTLNNYQGGPVRLEVTAGADTSMKCDASSCGDAGFGESVTLTDGFSLSAVLPQVAGDSISDVPITPYTHMAASRIKQMVLVGGETVDEAAVKQALGEVNALTGFDVATTKVVDITDASSFSGASVEEQRAAVLGAAVMNLTSGSKTVEEVLDELATTFEDGSFDINDEIQVSQLVGSWEQALVDEQIAGQIEDSVKTDIGLQVAGVAQATGEDGSYDPEASAHTGDTDVAKARALIKDTRSLVYNIAGTDFDTPMNALGTDFEAAAEVFDKDAAAMVELAGLGIEQLFKVLEAEGESLSDQLQQDGSVSKTITVELDGQSLGDLTLAVSSAGGLGLSLSGELTGTAEGARTVTVDNLKLTSDAQLADVVNQSTEQKTFTFTVSGGLNDGSTSMAISDGQLSVVFNDAPTADNEPVVDSLKLDDLTIKLMADGASFTGEADLHLLKPDADKVAMPLYDDLPLTLDLVSLDGTFVSADGASLNAGISLDLVDADKFDLLAFLNQDDVVHVSMYDSLSASDVTALQAQAQAAGAGANWHLEYGSYGDYDGQSYPFVWSSSDNGPFFSDADYASLKQVFDPEAALQAEFGQIDATVSEARLYVDAEGNTSLSGKVELGHMQETTDYFLKAKLGTHFELNNVDGLPPVKVAAEINRNQLNGGDATLLLSWDGEQYKFELEQLDVVSGTGKLTVTNPEGVSLTLTDLAEDETSVSGALYVGDKKVADVTGLDSGAVKVSYIDGTFETLQ